MIKKKKVNKKPVRLSNIKTKHLRRLAEGGVILIVLAVILIVLCFQLYTPNNKMDYIFGKLSLMILVGIMIVVTVIYLTGYWAE